MLFEDLAIGGNVVDIENDVELCWNYFPLGVKQMFLNCQKDGTNGHAKVKNDDLVKDIIFPQVQHS